MTTSGASAMNSATLKTASVAHTQARERTSAKPARTSLHMARAGRAGGRGLPAGAATAAASVDMRSRGRRRTISAALIRNVAASRPKAAAGLKPSTSTVASAGPANSARFWNIVVTALASWISSSGTVCGSSPAAAGR